MAPPPPWPGINPPQINTSHPNALLFNLNSWICSRSKHPARSQRSENQALSASSDIQKSDEVSGQSQESHQSWASHLVWYQKNVLGLDLICNARSSQRYLNNSLTPRARFRFTLLVSNLSRRRVGGAGTYEANDGSAPPLKYKYGLGNSGIMPQTHRWAGGMLAVWEWNKKILSPKLEVNC